MRMGLIAAISVAATLALPTLLGSVSYALGCSID